MRYRHLEDTPDFLSWYEHYPRKQCKNDARQAWKDTEKVRPPVAQMIRALAVQKQSDKWLQEKGAYIPYPATYLHREQWDDVTEIELGEVHNGKMWWETVSGIETKAKEVNFGEWNPKIDPTWQAYVNRLRKSLEEKVVPLKVAGE